MQLFINFNDKSELYDVDKALTIPQLKHVIENNTYIPTDSQ